MMRMCEVCGREFLYRYPGRPGRFCSHACYHTHQKSGVALRACIRCGQTFAVSPRRVKLLARYCSRRCYLQGQAPWNKGLTKKDLAGYNLRGGVHPGNIPWNKGKKGVSETTRAKISFASVGRKQSIETIEKRRVALKGRSVSEEVRRAIGLKNREHMLEKWRDPAYVLKYMEYRQTQPNKIERQVEALLDEHFPDFQYNGDGSLGVVLAGLVPDFVNVNGAKKVIEVFGSYWHRRPGIKWHQTEIGRTTSYNSVGFSCLILWENEVKNTKALVEKIGQFADSEVPTYS